MENMINSCAVVPAKGEKQWESSRMNGGIFFWGFQSKARAFQISHFLPLRRKLKSINKDPLGVGETIVASLSRRKPFLGRGRLDCHQTFPEDFLSVHFRLVVSPSNELFGSESDHVTDSSAGGCDSVIDCQLI